ncbi:putative hydrolase of the HAD superfamily [Neisseria perflava]|uniref:HAD family hydrolase n=1 Tax=Neisseria perflava TaxID=33053 RepID=UPI00209F9C3A|nr:HAD family hydrolase [Neisseria perflava]MCP1771753.1 putative hydrolase of the HAD superfamily [Neisseria perflava]
METINPRNSVIVFDLDDTLYAEYDYKVSGIRAVIRRVAELYPEFNAAALAQQIVADSKDWLDDLCRLCGFNDSEKQVLLWQYRLHQPDIKPYCSVSFLENLTRDFAATALISDGRSISQRLKLEALGLLPLFDDILISEAYRSEKPCDKRFVLLQNKYAADNRRFIYIGDNIKKDFVTPNRLGWLTIGLQASSRNIHRHSAADFPPEHQPHRWIGTLDELSGLIA